MTALTALPVHTQMLCASLAAYLMTGGQKRPLHLERFLNKYAHKYCRYCATGQQRPSLRTG